MADLTVVTSLEPPRSTASVPSVSTLLVWMFLTLLRPAVPLRVTPQLAPRSSELRVFVLDPLRLWVPSRLLAGLLWPLLAKGLLARSVDKSPPWLRRAVPLPRSRNMLLLAFPQLLLLAPMLVPLVPFPRVLPAVPPLRDPPNQPEYPSEQQPPRLATTPRLLEALEDALDAPSRQSQMHVP